MNKLKQLFLLLIIPGILIQSLRAQVEDTAIFNEAEIVIEFDENLDSMLNLYYVQQALTIAQSDSISVIDFESLVPDYPDSVYIERLRKLPFLMEMSYNRIVKNYIDVYAKKRPDKVKIMLSLATYYFPIFEEIFDQYGIPDELKYLSVIESALNPRAVSRAGATGMWQFMYYTGKLYGLTINSLVDERKNPIKSTYAAAAYLKDLYAIYKDWTMVIAAYNCGPGNVNKAIRRSGGKRNYWDIYYYLPRETRGYVPAFIAASYIMNYPKEHNLSPSPVIDFEFHTDTIMINGKLHLQQVSEVLNIPINLLRDLNPQYKYDIIPGDSKIYSLCIPQINSMRFIELKDSIFAYKESVYFNKDNVIITPTAQSSHYAPTLPSDKYSKLTYVVKSGDNLGFIAEKYNVRLSDLRYWNNIRTNMIRGGQKLTIYVPKGKEANYKNVDLLTSNEKSKSSGLKPESTFLTASQSEGVDYSADFEIYKVRSGDTLWDIAKKFPGVSDSDLMELNNLRDGRNIKPGQIIKIRKKG